MLKEELVQRIIAKSNAWITMSGHATGRRQQLEDLISAATTIAEVDALHW